MPLINIQLNPLSRAVSKVSVHKHQSPPCSYKCGVLESVCEFITVVFTQHWQGSGLRQLLQWFDYLGIITAGAQLRTYWPGGKTNRAKAQESSHFSYPSTTPSSLSEGSSYKHGALFYLLPPIL